MTRERSRGFTIPDPLAYTVGLALVFTAGLLAGHYFWPAEAPAVVAAMAPVSVPEPATPPAEPVPVIAAAPATPPPPAEPEFTLRGVFTASNAERSMALIADNEGRQKVYKIGQNVGGGYTLKSVGGKEAVVEKDGVEQTLPLKKQAASEKENADLIAAEEAAATENSVQHAEQKPESVQVQQAQPPHPSAEAAPVNAPEPP